MRRASHWMKPVNSDFNSCGGKSRETSPDSPMSRHSSASGSRDRISQPCSLEELLVHRSALCHDRTLSDAQLILVRVGQWTQQDHPPHTTFCTGTGHIDT